MTCRAQAGFVSHDLDFTQPTPMGFAQCRRCGGYFTIEQWAAWRCTGADPVTPPVVQPPLPPGGLRCALCGEAVLADPMHRAVMEWFGATCDHCFDLEAAHV